MPDDPQLPPAAPLQRAPGSPPAAPPAAGTESGKPLPSLDSQPLWIKVAALMVAIGGIIALIALYAVRL